MRSPFALTVLAGLAAALLARTALAQAVYKCGLPDGTIAYQDQPCADAASELPLPPMPRDSSGLAPVRPEAIAGAAPAGSPVPPELKSPVPPLPVQYRCYKAEDGSSYVSSDPSPPGRYVPLWVLDGYQPMFSGRTGAPAPRPPAGGPGVPPGRTRMPSQAAAGYTYVRDQCVRMGRGDLCVHFKAEYDRTNAAKRIAFNDTRPALEAEESTMRRQLEAHCWR